MLNLAPIRDAGTRQLERWLAEAAAAQRIHLDGSTPREDLADFVWLDRFTAAVRDELAARGVTLQRTGTD